MESRDVNAKVGIYSPKSMGLGIVGVVLSGTAIVILPMLYAPQTSSMFGIIEPIPIEIFIPTIVVSSLMLVIGCALIGYGARKKVSAASNDIGQNESIVDFATGGAWVLSFVNVEKHQKCQILGKDSPSKEDLKSVPCFNAFQSICNMQSPKFLKNVSTYQDGTDNILISVENAQDMLRVYDIIKDKKLDENTIKSSGLEFRTKESLQEKDGAGKRYNRNEIKQLRTQYGSTSSSLSCFG